MNIINYKTMKHKITINGKVYLKSYNFSNKDDCDVCDLSSVISKKNKDFRFSCYHMKSDCYEGFCFKGKKK